MRDKTGFGIKLFLIIAALLFYILQTPLSYAQGFSLTPPNSDPNLKVELSTSLKAGNEGILGDSIDIESGGFSLSATDVAVPGNSGLSVAFSRNYGLDGVDYHGGVLGSWNMDVPFITARTLVSDPWKNDRCTGTLRQWFPHIGLSGNDLQEANDDTWGGARMFIPGQGGKLLLETVEGPASLWGGSKPAKTTIDHWRVDCLASVQNGPGEGFEATAPDGTKYRFDYWAPKDGGVMGAFTSVEEDCGLPFCPPTGASLAYAAHTNIYATQVTDVNGNWVKYDYTDGRLTKIHSNDLREITLQYTAGNERIASITTNGRVWNYSYALTDGYQTLDKVTQPDTLFWDYDLEPQKPYQKGHHCNASVITGTLTVKHPNGVEGDFDYTLIKNGRNNATTEIESWTGLVQTQQGDFVEITAGCQNYKMRAYTKSKAITQKTLTIPKPNGANTTSTWSYWYEEDEGHRNYPNGTSALDLKKRIVTNPEGHESHMWYNRRHLSPYEGKLIKTERHSGSQFLEQMDYQYIEAPSLGDSTVRFKYDPSVTSERLGTQTVQQRDGDTYTSQSTYDTNLSSALYSFGGPISVTAFSNISTIPRVSHVVYSHKKSPWVLGLPASITVNGRNISSYVYDNLGQKTSQSAYGQTNASFNYNTDGTLNWVKDALLRKTTALNWKRGTAQHILRPDLESEYQTVDDNGWVISTEDAKGYITSYQYDDMGRTTLIDPTGNFWADTSIAYDFSGGGAVQTITKGQSQSIVTYDGMFRTVLEQSTDISTGWSSYVNTVYDALGQVSFTSQPSDSAASQSGIDYVYDGLGRLKTQSETVSPFAVTTYDYLTSHYRRVKDGLGHYSHEFKSGYDGPDGGVSRVKITPDNAWTIMRRNVWDELVYTRRKVNVGGVITQQWHFYYYDAQRRLCRHNTPEKGDMLMSFDVAGQMVSYAKGMTSGNSCTAPSGTSMVSMDYDLMGRLKTTNFNDSNTPDITRTYDANGNVTAVNRGTGANAVNWSYVYNSANMLDLEQLDVDGQTYPINYYYNASGHVNFRRLPSNRLVQYSLDGLGRSTAMTSDGTTLMSGASYHASGAVASLIYGNDHQFTQTLNARLQPQRLLSEMGGVKAIDQTFAYDLQGRVTSVTDGAVPSNNRSYGYDAIGRLTSAIGPWGSGSYVYDGFGNLKSKTLGSRNVTLHYDMTKNRLIQSVDSGASGTRTVGYDIRGNVTTLGSLAFAYDMSDQPTVVTGAANGNYVYDGNLKRVKSVVNGKTIYNVYDVSGKLVHVFDQSANEKTDYIAGPTGALVRMTNNVATYLHPDHLGSARAGTDSAGNIAWREQFTPFGEELVGHAANDNQAGFTGHIRDKATGLNYMQARYYDPIIGRFLSIDPVTFLDTGEPAMFNRYSYAFNDPVNLTDPDGECPVCVPIANGLHKAYKGYKLTKKVRQARKAAQSLDKARAVTSVAGGVGAAAGTKIAVESRSNPPGPLDDPTPDPNGQTTGDAEGRSHSIPGADGGYTTHGETNEGGFPEETKQFRPNAKQPGGGRAPNVKERGTRTSPDGKKHPGKSTKRPPRPEEIREPKQ